MFFIKNIFKYLADLFVKKSTRNITFFVLKWLSADFFEGKFVGKTTLVCRKIKKYILKFLTNLFVRKFIKNIIFICRFLSKAYR
jgi:hypothetical protein